jgi:hypothetical protein
MAVGGRWAVRLSSRRREWKGVALDTVRKYPIPCLLGAAALGFWIGRHRGKAITAAAAGLVTNAVLQNLNRVFEAEGLD